VAGLVSAAFGSGTPKYQFQLKVGPDAPASTIAIANTETPTIIAVDSSGKEQKIAQVSPLTDPAITLNTSGEISIVAQTQTTTTTLNVTVGTGANAVTVPLELEEFIPTAPVPSNFSLSYGVNKGIPLDTNLAVNQSVGPVTITSLKPSGSVIQPCYRVDLSGATFTNTLSLATLNRSNGMNLSVTPTDPTKPFSITYTSIGLQSALTATSTFTYTSNLSVALSGSGSSITMKQGAKQTVTLTTTPTVSASMLDVTFTPSDAFTVTNNGLTYTITGNKPAASGSMIVTPKGGYNPSTFKLEVDPSLSSATLSQTAFLLHNVSNVSLQLLASDGTGFIPTTNPTATINPANLATVTVTGPSSLQILPNATGAGTITLSLNGDSATVSITVDQVSGLVPLKADLQLVDYRTTRQLFGDKFSDQFYVVMAHLTNALQGANINNSILVYSNTFEASIQLEEQDDPIRNHGKSNIQWMPIEAKELEGEYGRAKENDLNRVPERFRARTIAIGQTSSVIRKPSSYVSLGPNESVQLTVYDSSGKPVLDASWTQISGPATGLKVAPTGFIYAPAESFTPNVYEVQATSPSDHSVSEIVSVVLNDRGVVLVTPDPSRVSTVSLDQGTFGQLVLDPTTTVASSDATIATVTPDCVISALKVGNCLITITTPPAKGPTAGTSPTVTHVIVRVLESKALPPGVFLNNGDVSHVHTRLRYRPYGADFVLSAHDAITEEGARSLVFRSLNFATGLANGLVVAFNASTAIEKGSSLSSSLLTPLLQQLWPDRSGTHRTNLQNYIMNPLEEIPFGGSIDKILIFPRQPIGGVLPSKLVRISAIDTQSFFVEVGIVSKTSSGPPTPAGSGNPTPPAGG